MKKKLVICLIAATLFSSTPLNVYAVGSASVNFNSNNTVDIGENIKVYMSIENIEDADKGIIGVGGKLIFDNNKLEFIEAKTVNTPYDFWFNPKSNKLAGLDFTFENAINKNTTIYEFTFKALEEGNTTITLDEAELSDTLTKLLNTNVYGKEITIIKKAIIEKEEVKPIEEKVNKTEDKKIEKEVKKETTTKEEITNKEKLEKVNNVVHNLLKKLTDLF